MEPVYDSDYEHSEESSSSDDNVDREQSVAKINQDRGGVAYPFAGSECCALFGVYDGHGEGGELVSQYALGEVQRLLEERLIGLNKDDKKLEVIAEDDDKGKNRNGSTKETLREEESLITKAFHDTFIKVDRGLLKESDIEVRECLALCVLHPLCTVLAQLFHLIHLRDTSQYIVELQPVLHFYETESYVSQSPTMPCSYPITYMYMYMTLSHSQIDISNAGDSRAVLAKRSTQNEASENDTTTTIPNLTTVPLSVDQNPDSPGEKERILGAGGFVSPPPEPGLSARVWLDAENTQIGLAMARSIGDHAVKDVGVIAKPVVTVHDVQDEDEFIILATDGVWEFMESEDAVKIVSEHLYCSADKDSNCASKACEALIKAAMAKWHEYEGDYRDDITAIVIRLKDIWKYH